MTVDKVIAKIIWLTFLAHPVGLYATDTVASLPKTNCSAYVTTPNARLIIRLMIFADILAIY